MYRLSANSRATISSTAIFLSQQSRQYFSSPRGSETSLAPHSAHRALITALRDIGSFGFQNSWFLIHNSRLYDYGTSNPPGPPPPRAERARLRRDEEVLYGPVGILGRVGARS